MSQPEVYEEDDEDIRKAIEISKRDQSGARQRPRPVPQPQPEFDENDPQLKRAIAESKKAEAKRRLDENLEVQEQIALIEGPKPGDRRPIIIDGNNVAWQ